MRKIFLRTNLCVIEFARTGNVLCSKKNSYSVVKNNYSVVKMYAVLPECRHLIGWCGCVGIHVCALWAYAIRDVHVI